KLVHGEREVLRGFRVQLYGGSLYRGATGVGAHFQTYDVGDVGAPPFLVDQHHVGLGERLKAADDCLLGLLDGLFIREASGDDRLYHREDVLGAVMDLLGQQFLTFLRLFPLGDVAADPRSTDDFARGILDRRYAERDINQVSILAHTDGLIIINPLTASDALKYNRLLTVAVCRDQDSDRLPDNLFRRIAEESLGSSVPGHNDAVQVQTQD